MGTIPLLTREEEIRLAKKIETTRMIFRRRVLESDYAALQAVEILQQVHNGDLPFDRTMRISTAEENAKEKDRLPHPGQHRNGPATSQAERTRLGTARGFTRGQGDHRRDLRKHERQTKEDGHPHRGMLPPHREDPAAASEDPVHQSEDRRTRT
jgi:hypothetical protein